jgi:hypothetical protein
MNTFWSLLPAFLGSTLGVTLVTFLWQWWTGRRENELTVLRDQLSKVYGPLCYFTWQNEKLFKLCAEYSKVYNAEFCEKQYAPEAQDSVGESAMKMIEESNSYIDDVKNNNKQVLALLRDNWHLVDVDDFECFSDFHVDMSRLERWQSGRNLNFALHRHLGPISFMRQEMIDRVKEKFSRKRKRLDQLIGNRPVQFSQAK